MATNRFEDFCKNFNDNECNNAKSIIFIKEDGIENPCLFDDNGQCTPSCDSLEKLKSEGVIEDLPDFCNITKDPTRFKNFCENIKNVKECNNAKSDILLENDGIEKPCIFSKKSLSCTPSCNSFKKLKSEGVDIDLPSNCL